MIKVTPARPPVVINITNEHMLLDMVDDRDKFGNTILHQILSGRTVVSFPGVEDSDAVNLVAKAFEPCLKIRNCDDMTPLGVYIVRNAFVVSEFSYDLFETLIKSPVFNFEDHHTITGKSLLALLLERHHSEKVESLFNILNKAKDAHKYHTEAIFHTRMEGSIEMAIKGGVDIKVKNKDGYSIAEHHVISAERINAGLLKVMVEHGAHLSLHINHAEKTISVFDTIQSKNRHAAMYNGHDIAFIQQQCLINEIENTAMAKRKLGASKPRLSRVDL